MKSQPTLSGEVTARRQFLGQVGKAAVTAPAIALLLAASTKRVSAQYRPVENPEPTIHPIRESTPRVRRRRRRRS